jgi:hypothetical protein
MKSVQSPASSQVNSSAQPDMGLGRVHPSIAQTTPVPGAVRIDVRRLARLVFYALLLPGSLGIGSDFVFGLFPLLTLATVVLVFPIAGFLIMRAALREMEGVIQQVAPEEEAEESAGSQANETAQDVAGIGKPAKNVATKLDQDAAIQHVGLARDCSER